jgi:hypothetical protein
MHYEANFRREESTAAVTDGGSGRCLLLRAGTRMGAGFAPPCLDPPDMLSTGCTLDGAKDRSLCYGS